jgi:hypothetical protein
MDILVLILAVMSQLTGLPLIVGESNDLASGVAAHADDSEFVQDGAGRLADGRIER